MSQKWLAEGESYFHLADLPAYPQTYTAVANLSQRGPAWTEKAILNVARTGRFSSDRTIHEYARDIRTLVAVPPGAAQDLAGT